MGARGEGSKGCGAREIYVRQVRQSSCTYLRGMNSCGLDNKGRAQGGQVPSLGSVR